MIAVFLPPSLRFFFQSAQAQDRHVILICIDGLRPEFYKDSSWSMVHLRQAVKTGAYTNGVNGVFPSITYSSHTTMVTGVKPSVGNRMQPSGFLLRHLPGYTRSGCFA